MKYYILLVLMWLMSITPLHAQSRTSPTDFFSIASTVGIDAAVLWSNSDGIVIPRSGLPLEEQNQKLEDAMKYYAEVKNATAGFSPLSGMQIGMSGIVAGAILYAGPQLAATIPLTLMGAAYYVSHEMLYSKLGDIRTDRGRRLLARVSKELVSAAQVEDFDALAKDPVLFRNTIIKSDRILQDVKRRASESGDPDLLNSVVDALQKVAAATDSAMLKEFAKTDEKVSDLDAQFGRFAEAFDAERKQILKRLDDYGKSMERLPAHLETLKDDVLTMKQEVKRLGRNQDLVADFMFSGLPPGEKARALRSGLMDDRIRCPKEEPACNPANIKAALVKGYEGQARIRKNVAYAGRILEGINDIGTIVGNMGLDLGEDGNKALQIASAATSAYISLMTNDPLGAIASITGMFGNRPDPDAERFRIMMGFLKQEFEVINEKLDAILTNQQTILEAVLLVSERLEEMYEHLDGRLESMAWEQRQMSDVLKAIIRDKWKPCFVMYRYAVESEVSNTKQPIVDLTTLRFRSFEDVRSVIRQRRNQILSCRDTVFNEMGSLSAIHRFGMFLDARLALDSGSVLDQGTPGNTNAGQAEQWRGIGRLYFEDVVAPARSIVSKWATDKGVSASTLLQLQTWRISHALQLRSLMDALERGEHFKCESKDETGRFVRELICTPGDRTADDIAERLMEFSINGGILLDIADWMMVLSQVANLYDGTATRFAESLKDLAAFSGISDGEEITRMTVAAIGLAIAHYSRVYGGITALAIAEDIRSEKADKRHETALRNNPYLAENTALLLLYLERGAWKLESEFSRPSFEDVYSQALLHARSEAANRFMPLYALFGRRHAFTSNDEAKIGLSVRIGDAEAFLPLPPPIRLSKGQFIFPPRYYALTDRQNLFINAYVDYELGKRNSLANIVLQR